MKIFVMHKLPGKFLDELGEKHEVEIWPDDDISREDLLKKVKGVDGIISLLTEKIDKEVMDAAGDSLKVISNYAVGFDNIDVEEATRRGIVVTNTPGVLTEAVAEHVIALMMAVGRNVVRGDKYVRSDKYHGWEPDLLVGVTFRAKTLGIVGLGRIGRWTARLACGLGMNTIYYSRSKDEEFELECGLDYREKLEDVLKESDVVSISVPLTEETEGLITYDLIKMMKKSAILINTARGPVVDEKGLIRALKEELILGAGLDVFSNEQDVNDSLFDLENVVLTPHIASATVEAREAMTELAVSGMSESLSGKKPENIVNEEVWEKAAVNS